MLKPCRLSAKPRAHRGGETGAIDHHRVERNPIRQVLTTHHLYYKCLAGRCIECVHDSQSGCDTDNMPDLDHSRKGDGGLDERQEHGCSLSDDQQVALGNPVNDHPSNGSQQEHRNRGCERDNP